MSDKETLKVRKYKVGYEVRDEKHVFGSRPLRSMIIKSAYTPEGLYIGSRKDARVLVVKYGIKPELAKRSNSVCSIGYSKTRRKWYGWSHRAIFGFGIGSKVRKGHVVAGHRGINVGFVAKNLKDCKKLAKAFASEVS